MIKFITYTLYFTVYFYGSLAIAKIGHKCQKHSIDRSWFLLAS